MSELLLSFCIPTYNRPERVNSLIKQFLSIKDNGVEMIIGDDNPQNNKTKKVVQKYSEPRLHYIKNIKNLGMDGNLLKIIQKSAGKFVFLMMDDDDIETNTIPWLLDVIKNENNISKICGTIGDKREGYKDDLIRYDNIILQKGAESLKELLFRHSHCSGIVLKKSAIDIKSALKFCGSLYIQYILDAQAMIKGDTLCTSKKFAQMGRIIYKSDQPTFKSKIYWNPVHRMLLWKYRIRLIYKVTKNFKHIRKILLKREIPRILLLYQKIFPSKGLIEAISNNFGMRLSRSIIYWTYIFLNVIINLLKINTNSKSYRIVKKFNNLYLK